MMMADGGDTTITFVFEGSQHPWRYDNAHLFEVLRSVIVQ